jgi:hypothetical protein
MPQSSTTRYTNAQIKEWTNMRGGLKILLYRGVHSETSSLKKVLFSGFLSFLNFWNYFQNHKYLCVIRKVKKNKKRTGPWQNPQLLGIILMKNVMGYAVMGH